MTTIQNRLVVLTLLSQAHSLYHCAPILADEPADTKTPDTTKQEQAEVGEEKDAKRDEIFAGIEYYAGKSNLDGHRRFSDGFWIGSGPVYPASVYVRGTNRRGQEAKLAYGTGDLYQGSQSLVKQPFEAWVQSPVGKSKLTLGKYYVPFGLQEWQFETKWGGMLERSFGRNDLAVSANYDQNAHHSNLYARVARNENENLTVGISAGLGRGLSYGSTHDRAYGIDLTAKRYGFRLQSEYTALRDSENGNFYFAYGRLTYEGWEKLQPFVARYSWNDKSGFLGQFGSTVIGATYQATDELGFEIATAKTSAKRVNWIQVHFEKEWRVFNKPKNRDDLPSQESNK